VLDLPTYNKVVNKRFSIFEPLVSLKLENGEVKLLVVDTIRREVKEFSGNGIIPKTKKEVIMEGRIELEDFKAFCKTLVGWVIRTYEGRSIRLTQVGPGIRWDVLVEGKVRGMGGSTSANGLITYLDKFNTSKSLNPSEYNGLVVGGKKQRTQHGYQIVPLIKLYLESNRQSELLETAKAPPTDSRKVISLVSGGPDSVLATFRLLKQGYKVLMMYADYGHPAVEQERKACLDFYELFKEKFPSRLSFLEITINLHGPKKVESAWGRTMALVGCAQMYNYSQCDNTYNAIAFGGHLGDRGPDVRPENMEAFEKVVEVTSKGTVRLLNPIAELDLEGIGKEFSNEGLPLDLTYNCFWETPCGYRSSKDAYRCQGCRRKAVSMKAAGYSEEDYSMPNSKTRSFQSPLAERPDY
jgi:7-cyano-7-deazaguanine synthase in queuosine biosynthesis